MSIKNCMSISKVMARGTPKNCGPRILSTVHSRSFVTTRPLRDFVDGGEQCTHNDLPVPEGDWQEDYDKKNSSYSMVLYSGIAAFIASIVACLKTESMEMNYYVPDLPEEDKKGKKK